MWDISKKFCRFLRFILIAQCFLSTLSCGTNGKNELEGISNFKDTSYLYERELINSKIGLLSYLNLKSDSSYFRIRIATNYSDSTEYFEFAGKDLFYSVNQKYVDIMNLGYRDSVIFLNNEIAKSVFFDCLEVEKVLYSIFKEQTDLNIKTSTDNDGIEFIVEGYYDNHYYRKIFYSILFTVTENQKIVENLLTIANVQSRILNINIPQIPKVIIGDEQQLLKPILEKSKD